MQGRRKAPLFVVTRKSAGAPAVDPRPAVAKNLPAGNHAKYSSVVELIFPERAGLAKNAARVFCCF